MLAIGSSSSLHTTSTCNALLCELQQLWIDIGESEAEKDRMLLDLERECLEVYRRKVDEAENAKARLHQSVAAKEAELATLMAALGDNNIHSPIKINTEMKASSLKEHLMLVTPIVEDLKVKKEERIKQFADIKLQIDKICGELSGYGQLVDDDMSSLNLGEHDLSVRKHTEYQTHLRNLQKEKSERLHKVLEYVNEVHSLCSVLGLDFAKTVSDVHPSLHGTNVEQSTNISDNTLEGLRNAILKLKTEKKVRLQKLKEIVGLLFEIWALMDSTNEEKGYFSRVDSFLASSESEIVEPNALSVDIIHQASQEAERLSKLKASRMKELVMKRKSELKEICYKTL